MTGFEPLIAAGTAGLTALVTDIVKGQGSNAITRLLSQDIGKGMQQVYFNASKQYIQNYAERHGSLKVLGMREPVSLESVYTAVQVLDCEDRSFASVEEMEKSFRKAEDQRFWFAKEATKEGLTIANEKQYLMVLGAPGCGKSTFLRKMGLEALKGSRGGFKRHRCIPVLLELKRFTDPKVEIKKLIATEFQVCGFPNSDRFTQKALEQGKLLILLDGLDEVPVANRDAVIETIQDFVDQHDKNRYITSCRIAAYRHNFRRFTDVTIAEFNDDQIKQFISNWFQSEADQQSGTAERCWQILQQSENTAAKELAHTPLLLTFLCLVYDRSQTFSNNRSTLYRKALRILLEEWAAEKRIMHQEIYQGLNTELEEGLLSEIAAGSFAADRLFLSQAELVDQIKTFLASNLNAPKHLSGEAVLNAIAVQQGILVERAEDVYSFSHLTLQEYLTARYIVDRHRIEPLVKEHFSDRRWREVFLLVAGSMVVGADELLHLMNRTIQNYVAGSLKLQALLQWTNQMTAPAPDNQQAIVKRAIVLRFVRSRTPSRAFFPTLDSVSDYLPNSMSFDFAHDLARSLDHDCTLQRSIERILTFTPDLNHNYDLDAVLNKVRMLAASPLFLFIKIDLALLLDQLELLRPSMPRKTAPQDEQQRFAAQVMQCYYDAFNLNSMLLDLTADDQKAISSYFYMNGLMVQCQREASRVLPQTWEAILETMLVPAGTS